MNNISEYIQPIISEDLIAIDHTQDIMDTVTAGALGDKLNVFNMILIAAVAIIVIFIIIKIMNMFKNTNLVCQNTDMFESLPEVVNETNVDQLTKCGWEVYISPTCPYCIRQQDILRQHYPTFKNIYTDKPTDVVPTWFNVKTNQRVPGMQTFENLQKMASC